jgi:hypothetical protein
MMKKLFLSFLLLFIATVINAQEVRYNNEIYKVKGGKIFNQEKEVTEELTAADKELIFSQANEVTKQEKELRVLEKKQKQAEKNQKKAEKALKKQEQTQKKYLNAERDYKKSIKKFEKLKRKGKLSSASEENWLDKIEKQKTRLEKAKKKL